MLKGYVKKGKPANWLSVPGAQPTRGPAKLFGGDRAAWWKKSPPKKQADQARRRRLRLYSEMAREFVAAAALAGSCPVVKAIPELRQGFKYGHQISARITEVHHVFGRQSALLCWKPGWLGVSKMGHRFIHSNINVARKHGWIAQAGDWNSQKVIAAQAACV